MSGKILHPKVNQYVTYCAGFDIRFVCTNSKCKIWASKLPWFHHLGREVRGISSTWSWANHGSRMFLGFWFDPSNEIQYQNHTCREPFSHLERFATSVFSFLEHEFRTFCDIYLWLHYDVLATAHDWKTAEPESVEHSFQNQKWETTQESASDR